jgi:hypothetical protein
MGIMYGSLYEALILAGTPREAAQRASEELANHESRFNKIDKNQAVQTAMLAINTTIVIALGVKAFF